MGLARRLWNWLPLSIAGTALSLASLHVLISWSLPGQGLGDTISLYWLYVTLGNRITAQILVLFIFPAALLLLLAQCFRRFHLLRTLAAVGLILLFVPILCVAVLWPYNFITIEHQERLQAGEHDYRLSLVTAYGKQAIQSHYRLFECALNSPLCTICYISYGGFGLESIQGSLAVDPETNILSLQINGEEVYVVDDP